MCQITIHSENGVQAVPAEPGQLLGEVLREYLTAFAMPCAGNHTCGKCKVRIEGAVSAPDEAELRLLSEAERAAGVRLACGCRIEGDVTVTLHEAGASKIVSWYETPAFAHTESGYGFAVDIGTTTVALQLIDRESGKVLAERLAENAQRGYGADVISRIEACKEQGVSVLSNRIADQLEAMAAGCMREAGVAAVSESVVTGNATMLHIYEGLDPFSLAVVPFDVQSSFGCISRRTLAGAPVYLPRCVGAYVGADIVCAVLAAGLLDGGVQLLADIGTNGEMALAKDGRLLCCSTAAGPAFEGAGLSCGMPAAPGAVRAVKLENGVAAYETVNGEPARGICGSGILDALAVMLETEAIDDTGYLEADWPVGSSGLTVTQKDVRQIQLAKSAVCAGLLTLMEAEGLNASEVQRFVIAGGFGSTMNFDSAKAIGLFPAALRERTAFVGNGALGGACMLLMNHPLREKSEQLAQEATELSLSTSASFMDYYVDCMSFMEF